MARLALPQNYIHNTGTILEDFSSIAAWTHIWPSGGIADNPIEYKTGTQSIKFTVTNGEVAASHAISKTFEMDGPRLIHIWFYLHTAASTFSYLLLRISSVTNEADVGSKNFYIVLNQNNAAFTRITEGWNHLVIHRGDWGITGGELWSNPMKWIRVSVASTSTNTVIASVDSLTYDVEKMARCMIVFDDGRASAYTEGYGYMSQKGIIGTCYINPPSIGTSTYMTLANLTTLYNAGWAIGNHTYNHISLTSLGTQAEMEAEINNCTNWLIANGYPRATYHFAYPLSTYNSTALAALSACGMHTGRIGITGHISTPGGNQMLLKLRDSGGAAAVKTLAEMEAFIDRAINYDATIILLFHELVTTITQTGTQWLISDFHSLIDYIIARKIQCTTIDEWYKGLTDPRYKSLLYC
jgi:peptidoglycan/xylan/chitin deacetylase (PgdA/CDA1 family)